jgi:hypothetical protein
MRRSARATLGFILAMLAACSGDPPASPASSSIPPGPIVPPPVTLHRLTVAQLQATLRDLLGPDAAVPTDLEADTHLYGFSSVGGASLTISPHGVEQLEAAAYEAIQPIFDDEARRAAFVGCEPVDAEDPCLRSFLDDLGMRAYRRPLAADELDRKVALLAYEDAILGSTWEATRMVVAGLLQSPHFVFRVEQGVADPEHPGELVFTGWEMASRLSYLFWNSMPDDELLSAAERGDLDTEDGVRSQAERLLASPRARGGLLVFWSELLGLQRLDDLAKNADVYPQMSPTLGASMRGELERMFQDIAFDRDDDLTAVFDTRDTFVNAELAELYGLPAPSGDEWARVTWPEDGPRGGLLGTAGLLSLYAHNTASSPTLRGKFVRAGLLCDEIPPPPDGVIPSLDDNPSTPTTMKERIEAHSADPACSGCHVKMDPIGVGLEHFDAIGAYREKDGALDIDSKSDLDGQPFDGPRELGALLRRRDDASACLARRFYRHATGHKEMPEQEPAIGALAASFAAAGHRLSGLAIELAASDLFRRATPHKTETP